ncbi:tetratricopeptide repeat protein [Marinoscillum furvescens]|uniref:Tetratricopeptide repeat protein n=1 Tax=Marinoscillum furvescens DSM 4134 TaxID=1122208 RepID=A0A3D9L5M2_MARFU|nr:tetratricopeptide repeat protein [Marinoscillum furvescens]REE01488.1 tetratricopeptide repeat protein [Marinoscillum furvescens DSM 4134]
MSLLYSRRNHLLAVCLVVLALFAKSQPKQDVLRLLSQSKSLEESSPDSALTFAQEALMLAEQQDLDTLLAKVHVALGAAWSNRGNYEKSLEHSMKAAAYAREYGDTLALIDAVNSIGIDLFYQEDYAKAAGYFQEVQQLAVRIGDSLRLGHALNNQGLVVGYLENLDQELILYEQARDVFAAIGEQEGYANTLLNAGTVHTTLGAYEEASHYFEQALAVYQELGFAIPVEQTLQSMSENLLAQGRYAQALDKAQEALRIARENSVMQDVLYSLGLIQKAYKGLGAYRQAYAYQQQAHALNDSLFNLEKQQIISELNAQYDAERKQQQIELLQAQNSLKDVRLASTRRMLIITIAGGVAVITVLLIIYFLYRRKQRAEHEARELRIEALQKRLLDLRMQTGAIKELPALEVLNGMLHNQLTEREYETLKLSLANKTNAEIADTLFVSVSTVKFHLRNIYAKLGVTNRKEAIAYVVRNA